MQTLMHYSIEPRDVIFVNNARFLPFAKNTGKSLGKSISKKLRRIYSQKLPDHAKKFATASMKGSSKNS